MSDRSTFLWPSPDPAVALAPAQPELRVVGGVHAGARVPLPGGDGALTVGADPGNDLVLRDAPFPSASVSTRAQAWTLTQGVHVVTLRAGQCIRMHPVILVICNTDDPWPDESACDAAIALSERMPTHLPEDRAAMVASPADAPPRIAQHAVRRRKPSRRWPAPWLGMAALLTVAAGSAVAMFVQHGGGSRTAVAHASPHTPTLPVSASELRDRIEALLIKRGLRHAVHASIRADGTIDIRGVVHDDDTLDSLIRAISDVTERVYPSLLTQSEFARRVQALAPSLPAGVQAAAAPGGVLDLRGQIAAGGFDALIDLVHERLPEAAALDLDDLRDLARSPLPPAPAIRTVVGGASPSVVLANGQRLLPGGVVGPLHLVSVGDSGVIFADDAGNTVTVPR